MSNTCDSTIAGPSQRNPDERSRQYTPISSLNHLSFLLGHPNGSVRSLSFIVQLQPARVLKQGIKALCDSGTLRVQIHVDKHRLKITTGDEEMDSLWMLSSHLINSVDIPDTFTLLCHVCRRPSTEPLVVNLAAVSRSLCQVQDDDTLTLYQVNGSNKLSISCESSLPLSGLSFHFPSFNPNTPDKNNKSFSFQLRPAGMLKRAIHVLCDSGVNHLGLAYIHADDQSFQITVDDNDGCTAVFFLPALMLRNFQCSKPSTVAQIVKLAEVSWNLAPVDDDDTVTVYQVDGSNQLSFVFACGSAQRSAAMLSTNVYNFPDNIGKFPQIVPCCEGRVISHDLSCSFQKNSLEAVNRLPVVVVEIEYGSIYFDFMNMRKWKVDFRRVREKGKAKGQKYRAWFECNFTKALRKACKLVGSDAEVQVCLSSVPAGNVVFQFNLTEAGPVSHLRILKRTLAIYPDADNFERFGTALHRSNVM